MDFARFVRPVFLSAMTPQSRRPLLVHPLASARPTGMAMAARGLSDLLVPEEAEEALTLNRVLRWINDHAPAGACRVALRIALVQLAPLLLPRRPLVFSSHHAPFWRTRRHVVIVHDLTALTYSRKKWLQAQYLKRFIPRVVTSASRIVTISQSVRRELRQLTSVDSVVIPSYSRTLEPRAQGPRSAARRNAVLVIGAHYSHKNLDLVLAAMALARKQCPSLRLIVAGCRPDLWAKDQGGLGRLEKEGWLTVRAYASDEELDQYWNEALCLMYPSLSEGQGLPPLEALARGCVLICSDIPVLRETCGDAAAYVDPHNPVPLAELLVDLANSTAESERWRQQSRAPAVLRRFSREEVAARWREFLRAWLDVGDHP